MPNTTLCQKTTHLSSIVPIIRIIPPRASSQRLAAFLSSFSKSVLVSVFLRLMRPIIERYLVWAQEQHAQNAVSSISAQCSITQHNTDATSTLPAFTYYIIFNHSTYSLVAFCDFHFLQALQGTISFHYPIICCCKHSSLYSSVVVKSAISNVNIKCIFWTYRRNFLI